MNFGRYPRRSDAKDKNYALDSSEAAGYFGITAVIANS